MEIIVARKSKLNQIREELAKTSTLKPVKKPRKKRVLTPEQKAVLVERMAKAREARGPAKHMSIDDSIRNLPDEHLLSPKKVKEWLKQQKEMLKALKHQKDSKDSAMRKQYYDTETYVFNLQRYLTDGVYRDFRYGAEKQSKIKHSCTVMAYYPDGTAKRTPGVFYADIGGAYTNEMAAEDYARQRKISNKKRVRKVN
jgi:uncharacterized protein (DUF885 family)